MALRASCRETSEGVETTMAPVSGTVWMSDKATSPVPGGRSTTRYSSCPQSTEPRNCLTIECSIGPRQMSGLSPGLRKPTEMTLSPCELMGAIWFSPITLGCSLVPSMSGTFGPYTSPSSNPTLWPILLRAIARLTESVVLPTPPLPEPTAMMALTPGKGCGVGCCWPGCWELALIFRLYGEEQQSALSSQHSAFSIQQNPI